MKRIQFERIQILLEQHRYLMARQELESVLLQNAEDPLAHALLAHCLLDLGETKLALKHAQTAVGLAPDVGFCYYTLGIVVQEQGSLRQARKHFQEALSLEPEDPDYFVRLGLTYLQDYRWQEALNCAEQALSLFPEHLDAMNLQSMALLRMGKAQHAASHLEQALKHAPENARIHASRGWTQLHQGAQESALKSFTEALRLEPDLNWAREGLLETLKARYWVYRTLQRYFFWMSRHGRKYQFLIMVGLIVLIRGLTRITDMYSDSLTYALILVYFIFAVLTWLADPLFNLLLSFHPSGRYILLPVEKKTSRYLGLFLGSSIIFVCLAVLFTSPLLFLLSALNFMMLVPLAGTLSAPKETSRQFLGTYTVMLAFLVMGLLFSFQLGRGSVFASLAGAFLIAWLAFSWLANWLLLKA